MTSCFPFFSSKKSKKEKKSQQSQEIDDIPTDVPPTGTPVVNLEAERLQDQKNQEEIIEEAKQQTSDLPSVDTNNLPATSNQSAIPEEPEVTTHVHTHEVVTIKEYIPQNNGPTEKELNAELKAALAELKCAQLKLQVVQDENVALLEKNLDYCNLKKKDVEREKELRDLKDENKKLLEQIDKSKEEVKNYQNHINTAGQEINNLRRKLIQQQTADPKNENDINNTVSLLLDGLKEAYDEINHLDEKERDYLVMANEAGEEIYELKKKLRDTTILINECGQELVDLKCENEDLKKENDIFGQIITCLSSELNAANKKIEQYQDNTNELMLIANETGEEIIKLQQTGRDKSVTINETGQEICQLKIDMDQLRRENNLLKEVFKTLLEEYKVVKKENDSLVEKENDLLILANEAGEEINNLIKKEREANVTINEAATELLQTKAENALLKKNEEQCLAIIEAVSNNLLEANRTIEKLHNENQDLLNVANETGEEIINLKRVQKDQARHVSESCQELVDSKVALSEVTAQNNNYEQIISGLVEMLNNSKKEIEDMKNRENDLLALANETGEEIRSLRMKQNDARLIANETGSELVDLKDELNRVKAELNLYKQASAGKQNQIINDTFKQVEA